MVVELLVVVRVISHIILLIMCLLKVIAKPVVNLPQENMSYDQILKNFDF